MQGIAPKKIPGAGVGKGIKCSSGRMMELDEWVGF